MLISLVSAVTSNLFVDIISMVYMFSFTDNEIVPNTSLLHAAHRPAGCIPPKAYTAPSSAAANP
jgi:hypothetical protein